MTAGDESMMLYSFRLPAELVRQIDELADRDRKRRADLVRDALAQYVRDRIAPVERDEAERALDVLRKLVQRTSPR